MISNHHIIDISLENIDPEYVHFLHHVCDIADRHGVKVWLSKERTVPYNDGSSCNGFFTDKPYPALAVACGQPLQNWFKILIHESSHMDQWIEGSSYWKDSYVCGIEAINIIELWLQDHINLVGDKKWEMFRVARNVEMDCERRSVQKIINWDFPDIDASDYAQRGNAYVLFYNILAMHKQWYATGKEPYNSDAIKAVMPTSILDDKWYEPGQMSDEIYDALVSCIDLRAGLPG